jgi:hypothetical protein
MSFYVFFPLFFSFFYFMTFKKALSAVFLHIVPSRPPHPPPPPTPDPYFVAKLSKLWVGSGFWKKLYRIQGKARCLIPDPGPQGWKLFM